MTSFYPTPEPPLKLDSLVLDDLPKGKLSRVMLTLVHDGLGHPIKLPILIIRGQRTGPVFGITAALHGNELNGIPVVHRLMKELDPKRVKGMVVAAVAANVPGLLMHRRELNDGTDLNHVMPGAADGNMAAVYAHRLVERVIRHFDYLLDLHTASTGRVNSLYVRANMDDTIAANMARLLRPQIILHNPPSDRTLRGTAEDLGIPAITVEIGNPHVYQPTFIRNTIIGVRRVLAFAGVIARRPPHDRPPPMVCDRSRWIYTDHGGLLQVLPPVAEVVEAGQVIARLTDAFGQVTREYLAPEQGVVIGKSVYPVAQTGARILHLGHIAPSRSPLRENRDPTQESST